MLSSRSLWHSSKLWHSQEYFSAYTGISWTIRFEWSEQPFVERLPPNLIEFNLILGRLYDNYSINSCQEIRLLVAELRENRRRVRFYVLVNQNANLEQVIVTRDHADLIGHMLGQPLQEPPGQQAEQAAAVARLNTLARLNLHSFGQRTLTFDGPMIQWLFGDPRPFPERQNLLAEVQALMINNADVDSNTLFQSTYFQRKFFRRNF